MSYDFLVMKPRTEIRAVEDLGEDALVEQDPAEVVGALTAMFPASRWKREPDGAWFGSLAVGGEWVEFRLPAEPSLDWSVCTSHGAKDRRLVQVICDALHVIAFDGQAGALIRPDSGGGAV